MGTTQRGSPLTPILQGITLGLLRSSLRSDGKASVPVPADRTPNLADADPRRVSMTATNPCRPAFASLAALAGIVLLSLLPELARSDNPPASKVSPAIEKNKPHWAFQPARRPALPRVLQTARARTA